MVINTINRASLFACFICLFEKGSTKIKLFYRQFSIANGQNHQKIAVKGALPGKNWEKRRVLVAPLDWGLGHATRCIPLIRQLEEQGAEIWLAGEGPQETLLRAEFPHLPFLTLKGYRIQYSRSGKFMIWKMLRQIPAIKKAIRYEHEWLKKMFADLPFDEVISDNRYGLHHPNINSIIITHQLRIKTGLGSLTENILQRWNYTYLEKFDQCWIPDLENDHALAGELSHPDRKPSMPVTYLGPLSRFISLNIPTRKNKLLIILSGPEPQRTILEEKIFRDIAHYDGEATVVRGLPSSQTHVPSTGMINIYNHLSSEELNKEMNEAELVIARSGYSTIMDSFTLGKKCIFIPTPGQTEQEYLGNYLQKNGRALCVQQKTFDLRIAIEQADQFNYSI
mgnify:CR=1 FL=1